MKWRSFRATLRRTVESTSTDMLRLSEDTLQKNPKSEEYFSYEASYKAHLYHTLLQNEICYMDMHLEWRPEKPKVLNNHIDLWYRDPDEEYNVLIEVKQVYGVNRSRDDIRPYDYRVKDPSSGETKSGIIKDVIKLCDSCGIKNEYHGVMLMFWADPKVKEDLDLDVVKGSILRQVREERPSIRKTRVELLWSSEQKTDYRSLS